MCLSLNGYAVFSLINEILAHGCDGEYQRIKSLREGVERDSVKICAHLLNHNSAATSVYMWVFSVAQSTVLSEVKERTRDEGGLHFMTTHPLSLPNRDVILPGLPSGTASIPTNSLDELLNFKRARCTSSIFVVPPRSTNLVVRTAMKYRRTVIIDPLPDDVLVLEIFDLCLHDPTGYPIQRMRKWLILAHVCRRWRRIYLLSAHTEHPSGRIWFTGRSSFLFPLNIDYPRASRSDCTPGDDDSILAALTHADRIHVINIHATYSLLRKVAGVMQESFPELTYLSLGWDFEGSPAVFPVLPEGFLGGSAQRLQHLYLGSVSFPGLPILLSSDSNLVTLRVGDISHISPEAMVSALAVTTRLGDLVLTFHRKGTQPDHWRSPSNPPNHAILPPLTYFHFEGHIEYLKDLLALVDTPILYNVKIEYFKESFVEGIQVPQLSRFIGRTEYLCPVRLCGCNFLF